MGRYLTEDLILRLPARYSAQHNGLQSLWNSRHTRRPYCSPMVCGRACGSNGDVDFGRLRPSRSGATISQSFPYRWRSSAIACA